MQLKLNRNKPYQNITTPDYHATGEPLGIVTGGVSEPKSDTMLEKREYIRGNMDHYRQALMHEPRGHVYQM
mgnify:FL=1